MWPFQRCDIWHLQRHDISRRDATFKSNVTSLKHTTFLEMSPRHSNVFLSDTTFDRSLKNTWRTYIFLSRHAVAYIWMIRDVATHYRSRIHHFFYTSFLRDTTLDLSRDTTFLIEMRHFSPVHRVFFRDELVTWNPIGHMKTNSSRKTCVQTHTWVNRVFFRDEFAWVHRVVIRDELSFFSCVEYRALIFVKYRAPGGLLSNIRLRLVYSRLSNRGLLYLSNIGFANIELVYATIEKKVHPMDWFLFRLSNIFLIASGRLTRISSCSSYVYISVYHQRTCMYIYKWMNICISVYIYMCVYITDKEVPILLPKYIYIRINECIYTCIYIYIYT